MKIKLNKQKRREERFQKKLEDESRKEAAERGFDHWLQKKMEVGL